MGDYCPTNGPSESKNRHPEPLSPPTAVGHPPNHTESHNVFTTELARPRPVPAVRLVPRPARPSPAALVERHDVDQPDRGSPPRGAGHPHRRRRPGRSPLTPAPSPPHHLPAPPAPSPAPPHHLAPTRRVCGNGFTRIRCDSHPDDQASPRIEATIGGSTSKPVPAYAPPPHPRNALAARVPPTRPPDYRPGLPSPPDSADRGVFVSSCLVTPVPAGIGMNQRASCVK